MAVGFGVDASGSECTTFANFGFWSTKSIHNTYLGLGGEGPKPVNNTPKLVHGRDSILKLHFYSLLGLSNHKNIK